METVAFVQGILSVIGLLMVVGMVWATRQVLNLKEQINSVNRNIDLNWNDLTNFISMSVEEGNKNLDGEIEHTHHLMDELRDELDRVERELHLRIDGENREIEKQIEEIYRSIDSRFDKFENRLKSDRQILND